MKYSNSRIGWHNFYNYFNQYDISKYVLNFYYYEYTKKFGTNQVAFVKKLTIIVVVLTILFFSALIIELVCCIVNILVSPLYGIGIFLCVIWGLLAIFCIYTMRINAKRYYKVIDLLMGNGSLSPVAVEYPRIVYTMLWYFHDKPMWWGQWINQKGVVPQSWYGYNKSLALFIDRLNDYYLHHNQPTNAVSIVNQ